MVQFPVSDYLLVIGPSEYVPFFISLVLFEDPIFYSSTAVYLVFMVLIVLWQPMIQPETSQFLFFRLPHTESQFFPQGAGLDLGILMFSTAHASLIYIYWLASMAYVIYSYLTLDLAVKTKEAKIIRAGLLSSFILTFFWILTLFPYLNVLGDLTWMINVAYLIEGY